MKNLKFAIIFILFSIAALFSFSPNQTPELTIEGTWVYTGYEKNVNILTKYEAFKKDKPGFQLNADGTMLKRQNSGWCGTPPISYTNAEGTWELETESILRFEYNYWGGRDTMRMEIIEHESNVLKLKRFAR